MRYFIFSEFPGAEYAAHCYCGHQFGQFAGQLGDGATMYVGSVSKNREVLDFSSGIIE